MAGLRGRPEPRAVGAGCGAAPARHPAARDRRLHRSGDVARARGGALGRLVDRARLRALGRRPRGRAPRRAGDRRRLLLLPDSRHLAGGRPVLRLAGGRSAAGARRLLDTFRRSAVDRRPPGQCGPVPRAADGGHLDAGIPTASRPTPATSPCSSSTPTTMACSRRSVLPSEHVDAHAPLLRRLPLRRVPAARSTTRRSSTWSRPARRCRSSSAWAATGGSASCRARCRRSRPTAAARRPVTLCRPRRPGTAGCSTTPHSDTYTWVWKPVKAWGGTCRTLTVSLDDGTQHTALFRFK